MLGLILAAAHAKKARRRPAPEMGSVPGNERLGIPMAVASKECGPNGDLRVAFAKVVTKQIGTKDDFLQFKHHVPIKAFFNNMTKEEQTKVVFAIITQEEKPFSASVHYIIEATRSVLGPLLKGKTLADAIFEDPRPTKNFGKTLKDIKECCEKYLDKYNTVISERVKAFFNVAIEVAEAMAEKVDAMMSALEKSEHCGYWKSSCPGAVTALKVRTESVVADKCYSWPKIRRYAGKMGRKDRGHKQRPINVQ